MVLILFSLLTTYLQRPTTKADTKPTMGRKSKSRSHSNRPIQVEESAIDLDIPEDKWPTFARLSVGGLSQQGRFIREICRDAIIS